MAARLPEAEAERVEQGFVRGHGQLGVFMMAMAHELEANAHKGQPEDQAAIEHVRELIYHACKLYMAVRFGHREATLEYAADCGNHAWMAASAAGTLDLDLLTVGLEGGGSIGLYDELDAESAELAHARGEAPELAMNDERLWEALREAPWTVPAEHGGFYEPLKAEARGFSGQLNSLMRDQQKMHGRHTPAIRESLGARNPPAEKNTEQETPWI
jgi:hypothetical protein